MCRPTFVTSLFSAFGMLVLILDGKTALNGAASGITLCIRTVIPSLFPFLFLCSLLTGSLWGISYPWLRPLARRLGIPEGAESLLIVSFLGGYPAGAQTIGEAFRQDRLTCRDAEHLLGFCSNAGPAFLFGMVSLSFPDKSMVWAMWAIQILSAMLTGCMSGTYSESKATFPPKNTDIPQILLRTVRTMGSICGWILMFSVFLAFARRWFLWLFPPEIQVLVLGILELSSGCCALQEIPRLSLRFLIANGILCFGGLCVLMQTSSVIGTLPIKVYLKGKLKQLIWSLMLSVLYLLFGWCSLMLPLSALFLFPAARKKSSGFPSPSGV